MFGYRDGQVIGMPLWDLTIDRDNRMPDEISGMPVVRAHQTTSAEVVLFRKDGEPIWCLVQARPIQSETPGLESLREAIYTFQNISEMKRQREALSRSLLELNVVLDATATGVMHLQDDRVVRCNAQAQRMFGRPGAELVGTSIGALFAPEADYFEAITPLRTQLASGSPASFEALMKGPGGTFWGLVSLRRVGQRAGRPDRLDSRHFGAQEAGRGAADGAGAAAADFRYGAGGTAVRARWPSGARQQRDGRSAGMRTGWPGQADPAFHASDRPSAAREPVRALCAHPRYRGLRVRALHVSAQGRPDLGRGAGPGGQSRASRARLHLRLRRYRRAQAFRARTALDADGAAADLRQRAGRDAVRVERPDPEGKCGDRATVRIRPARLLGTGGLVALRGAGRLGTGQRRGRRGRPRRALLVRTADAACRRQHVLVRGQWPAARAGLPQIADSSCR